MREIIFRGKCKSTNEWVYGCLVAWGTSMNYEIFDNGKIHQVKEDTIGQFTGLTDKNGVKIFDGDICFCCDEKYEVELINIGGAHIVVNSGVTNDKCFHSYSQGKIEIIGNIHDNG